MSIGASRRSFLAALGAVPAAALQRPALASYWTHEYWAQKGDVRLYMFRKRRAAPSAGERPLPVLFLVHGSSMSGRSTFDLDVPGTGDYSMMNAFAGYGFDVWTMDFEGYGRSARTEGNSNIAEGVKDLKVATDLVMHETGRNYTSSANLRVDCARCLRDGTSGKSRPPCSRGVYLHGSRISHVDRPCQAARVFIARISRRPRDRDMIRSIFTRDKVGTADPAVAEALANAELPFGDSVPTGTYLDMTANLPVVDPMKVRAPVLLVRGEYDGIATEEDLINFFTKLPNGDRQLTVLGGMAHSVVLGYNRDQLWQVTRSFLERPARQDHIK